MFRGLKKGTNEKGGRFEWHFLSGKRGQIYLGQENKSVPFFHFSDGKVLQTTIDDLKSGKLSPADLPAVRVFEKDGLIYSLDNRRVLAASAAGVPIKIVPATEAEIAAEIGRKMTTPNNGSIICVRGICK